MTERIVHLVRHGESTWNAEARLQGQTAHVLLTDRGRAEACATAGVLAGLVDGSAVLWSSDLARAVDTAHVIAQELALLPVYDEALRELSYGQMEGRLIADLPCLDGSDHGPDTRWPGGESLRDVYERVGAFFDRGLSTAPRHVVVVSHGETLRVATALLLGLPVEQTPSEVPGNGSVVSLRVADR